MRKPTMWSSIPSNVPIDLTSTGESYLQYKLKDWLRLSQSLIKNNDNFLIQHNYWPTCNDDQNFTHIWINKNIPWNMINWYLWQTLQCLEVSFT